MRKAKRPSAFGTQIKAVSIRERPGQLGCCYYSMWRTGRGQVDEQIRYQKDKGDI